MLARLRVTAITLALSVSPTVIFSQAQPNTTFAPVVNGLVLRDVECSEFHSRFTGHDYHVYVSLPASYRQGDRRYPVLYVPDFEEGFLFLRDANDLIGLASILKKFILEDFILVGVPLKSESVQDFARKRTFDLTPTEDEAADKYWSNILGGEVHSGGAPLFLRTLKEELIPYIDQNYRTLAAQQSRGILGQSRGGNQAFHVAFKHPELFSSLGVFHNALPALTSQTYPALQNAAGLNAQIPLIVLNGADQDSLVTFQSFLDAHNRLVSLGIAHVLQIFSGDHSWFNFRREFVDFVTRL